jgi:hypothetical protein
MTSATTAATEVCVFDTAYRFIQQVRLSRLLEMPSRAVFLEATMPIRGRPTTEEDSARALATKTFSSASITATSTGSHGMEFVSSRSYDILTEKGSFYTFESNSYGPCFSNAPSNTDLCFLNPMNSGFAFFNYWYYFRDWYTYYGTPSSHGANYMSSFSNEFVFSPLSVQWKHILCVPA